MQDYPNLTPDAETFARVWKRVMPDESLSQIVVHAPEEHGQGEVEKPPVNKTGVIGDEERLRGVLEAMDEGMMLTGEIFRRQPGAWPLRENLRTSAAQLRAAWQLLTGRRWRGAGALPSGRESFQRILREQYLWEIRFSQLCREAGEQMRAEDLREIFPEQEEASRKRRRMVRHLLGGI